MNRIFSFLLLVITIVCPIQAQQTDTIQVLKTDTIQVQVQQFAQQYLGTTTTSMLQSVSSADVHFDVLQRENNQGFVLVANGSQIIGYSDTGYITDDNMPLQLKQLLSQYSNQVDKAQNTSTTQANTVRWQNYPYAIVEPLLKTNWDQGFPYNFFTPKIDGKQSPTGCAATAVSQVLYFHKWPENRPNLPSYQEGTAPNVMGGVYQWDKMLDTYRPYMDSQEANEAVAMLMSDVGIAVKMNYGANESSASMGNVFNALIYDFQCHAQYIHRRGYSTSEFTKLITDELKEGRPIIYSGVNDGGHAWVCDGLDSNGFLHMNWGWSNNCDGYYDMDKLSPTTLGIGGGSGNFNYQQGLIFVNPNKPGSTPYTDNPNAMTMTLGGMGSKDATHNGLFYAEQLSCNKNERISIKIENAGNFTQNTILCFLGVGIFDANNQRVDVQYVTDEKGYIMRYSIPPGAFGVFSKQLDVSKLNDGEYTLYPMSALTDESNVPQPWVIMRYATPIKMKIENDKVELTNTYTIDQLEMAELPQLLMPIYANYPGGMTLTIKNPSQNIIRGQIEMMLVNEQSNATHTIALNEQVFIIDGGTASYTFSINPYINNQLIPLGRYLVKFFMVTTNKKIEITNGFSPYYIDIKDALQGGYLEYQNLQLLKDGQVLQQDIITLDDVSKLTIGLAIKNISNSTYQNPIYVSLKDVETGQKYELGSFKTNINGGQTTDVMNSNWQISVDPSALGLASDKLYSIHLEGVFNNVRQEFWSNSKQRRYVKFAITTSINKVSQKDSAEKVYVGIANAQLKVSAPLAIQDISVVSLQGKTMLQHHFAGQQNVETISVSSLNKGIYVVRVKTVNKLFTQKIMIQ